MAQKSKARVFGPGHIEQPGMDFPQAKKDMSAWRITFEEMICKMTDLGDMAGPQVGNPYDADAIGEERTFITHLNKSGKGTGHSTV